MRWNEQQQASSHLQSIVHRVERAPVVVNMLQNVEANDRVEEAELFTEILRISLRDPDVCRSCEAFVQHSRKTLLRLERDHFFGVGRDSFGERSRACPCVEHTTT